MIDAFSLPPVQAYQPATFRERGVAVPFTTPTLAGARARRGARHNLEMIVPNPSGGRGIYILPWNSMRSMGRPTVHDSRLHQAVTALRVLTPATTRQVVLDVAAEGFAGRQAMAAAADTAATDQKDRDLTHFLLLAALAEQAEPAAFGRQREWSAETERLAREIAARFAPALERSATELLADLAALTTVLYPIGTAGQRRPARVPRLIAMLTELRAGLAGWMRDHCGDSRAELANMIAGFAGLTVTATQTALSAAHGMMHNLPGLVRSWGRSPERITELAGRPEWLLDGWQQVCLLWRASERDEQRTAVITEMAHLVPVLPREMGEWVALPAETEELAASRTISLNQTRRTGAAMQNLTARNEHLRALTV